MLIRVLVQVRSSRQPNEPHLCCAARSLDTVPKLKLPQRAEAKEVTIQMDTFLDRV